MFYRYYKFSRTRNEVPTFGEIYHRNIASQASNSSQYRSTSNNFYTSQTPIVEMPATPDCTLRPTSRQAYGSVNNSMIGVNNTGISNNMSNTAHSSGYSSFSQKTATSNGGPVISPLITTANEANMNANNNNNNWFSSSSASSIQQSYEPNVKQNENFSTSSTRNNHHQQQQTTTHHASTTRQGGEEEEEEIFMSGTESDPDRQFRPIYQPVLNDQNDQFQHQQQLNFSYEQQQQQQQQQWPNSSRI